MTATASGSLAGLGNGDVIITLNFPNASGATLCTNKGGTEAPGQNPALGVSVSGSQFVDNPKNGTLRFSVTTLVPPNPSPAEAGCANANWSASFSNITFGCGTLTVQQETFQGSGVYVTVLTANVCL